MQIFIESLPHGHRRDKSVADSDEQALAVWYAVRLRFRTDDRKDPRLLSPLEKGVGPEAFLNHLVFALPMARFPEAERRRLHKMICMRFVARD